MVSVASLLNPISEESRSLPSPHSTRFTSECSSQFSSPPYKKQKMSKDAAVFVRGAVHGRVRFPPWEEYDRKFSTELQRYSVYPLGRITEYPRHIPYNSDKKSFLEKTGRGAFEVFQYTFKLPGDGRQYTVMWDYNIGLVRITPFFKCCQYAKTVPAKMLNSNPGLREICHSITGGALVAQGYWMPFEAAKAIAATFCYGIRYALTPLFGPSFASACIKPSAEGFGQMIIDPQIIRQCAEEARHYRETSSRDGHQATDTGISGFTPVPATTWAPKALRPRTTRPLDIESGYCTDTDRSEQCLPSPQSTFTFGSKNATRSANKQLQLPSPREILGGDNLKGGHNAPPNSPDSSGSNVSPKTMRRYLQTDDEEERREEKEGLEGNGIPGGLSKTHATPSKRGKPPITSTKETRAAYVLMQLHFADTSLKESENRAKKRRASS